MECPRCLSEKNRVVDSRPGKEPQTVRRRRICKSCGHRFTTRESIIREQMFVIKRDGRREPYKKEKILNSVSRAVEKLGIDAEQLRLVVTEITNSLEERFGTEIPSSAIGECVLQQLKKINGVAYLRFASVYKEFRSLNDYDRALAELRENHA